MRGLDRVRRPPTEDNSGVEGVEQTTIAEGAAPAGKGLASNPFVAGLFDGSNPYFTAGFGLVLMGSGLALLRKGLQVRVPKSAV
jgi:hypothetical protein